MPDYWNIPKIWEGETAYILGGGASIIPLFGIPQIMADSVRKGETPMLEYSDFMEVLHDKNVIGVNAAFKIGSWIDYIYFLDKDFMLTYRPCLAGAGFSSKTVSALPYSQLESWCNTVKGSPINGICAVPDTIAYNHNSGAGAINLAYHLGAKRIVLIGFDMKVIDNKQHFHGEYINSKLERPAEDKMTFSKGMLAFPAIANDAEILGVEIINTSMDSALDMFEKIPLEDVL